MEVARFERRILSYLIDMIIPFGVGIFLGVYLIINTSMPWYFSFLCMIAFCFCFYIVFNLPFFYFTHGRTIGAFLFRIKTIKEDNSNIKFVDALIKMIYFALVPVVLVNALYMLIVHTERTAFDHLTKTIVVDKKHF